MVLLVLLVLMGVSADQWDCMSPHSQLDFYSDQWTTWYPKLNSTATLTVIGKNPNTNVVTFDAFNLWFMHGVNMTSYGNMLADTQVVQPSANFSFTYSVYFGSDMFKNESYWVFLSFYDGNTEISCWHMSEVHVSGVFTVIGAMIYLSLLQ